MKDIPLFTGESGVASLTLSQIPYTGSSYIRIQSAVNGEALLRECVDFCRGAGAESIYATGHDALLQYPHYTDIWRMVCHRKQIPATDAVLVPVNADNAEQWRCIYNNKMRYVPNASVMTMGDAKRLPESETAFFIMQQEQLLGIGMAGDGEIKAVAAVVPGSGKELLSALNSALSGETLSVEVASENHAAVRLYKAMGFELQQVISQWYKIL